MGKERLLKREIYKLKTQEMINHAFSSYLVNADQYDELGSLTCTGYNSIGNFSLTLIDSLDTFVVTNSLEIFQKLVPLAARVNFDIDVNVSVFETSIRIIGGLLSSHIQATANLRTEDYPNDTLLHKAIEVADKLLVAFDTPTGLPYGTVCVPCILIIRNLMHGVPKDETPIVCTACAGSFHIEFAWLSLITGDPMYVILILHL
jgi:mannosidase alpha-like ER degradation enhancer 2